MTTATQLTAATIAGASSITSIVGTRYWPDYREIDTLPSLTFRDISEIRYDPLDGPGSKKRVRMQINCYAATRTAADALADAVENVLSLTGRIVFRQSTYDVETQIYWAQLDWMVPVATP